MRTEIAIRLMGQEERVMAVELLDELMNARPSHSAWPLLHAVRHDIAEAEFAEAATIARAEMAYGLEAHWGDPPDEEES